MCAHNMLKYGYIQTNCSHTSSTDNGNNNSNTQGIIISSSSSSIKRKHQEEKEKESDDLIEVCKKARYYHRRKQERPVRSRSLQHRMERDDSDDSNDDHQPAEQTFDNKTTTVEQQLVEVEDDEGEQQFISSSQEKEETSSSSSSPSTTITTMIPWHISNQLDYGFICPKQKGWCSKETATKFWTSKEGQEVIQHLFEYLPNPTMPEEWPPLSVIAPLLLLLRTWILAQPGDLTRPLNRLNLLLVEELFHRMQAKQKKRKDKKGDPLEETKALVAPSNLALE